MSLRDQLFKAGLVDADKVHKTEVEKRKKGHKLKKDKHLAAAEADQQRAEQARLARELEAQQERDRELNRQREAHKRERERAAATQQLIAAHRLKSGKGEQRYNFVDDRWVRNLRVSDAELRQLTRGQLAIVRCNGDQDYGLLPREAALRLAELEADRVLVLNNPDDVDNSADDWPDDWPDDWNA